MSEPITIITVAFNSQEVLGGMIDSVPANVPIVVVDNGSRDPQSIENAAGRARVVRLDENVGFGRGCNAGAELADSEYLFFLNPDARLEPDTLEALLTSARAYPNVSGWNPVLLDRGGNAGRPRRAKLPVKPSVPAPAEGARDIEIETLHGSAIFVRAATFRSIGGFDPAIFLYHEDDDLSVRLSKLGPLMCSRTARVQHLSGRGSPRTPEIAKLKGYHLARSRVYVHRKHGSAFPLGSTLFQAFTGLLSPLMLSRRKRAKQIGFVQGALSAARDGGRFD